MKAAGKDAAKGGNAPFRFKKRTPRPAPGNSQAEPEDKVRARQERFKKLNSQAEKEYGLVSRGEEKTLKADPVARQDFFELIQVEFVKHCSAVGDKELLRDEIINISKCESDKGSGHYDIDWVLMSLRKLRESLLAIEPDNFTKRVFLYSARLSTKIGHYQGYLPSLNFLLHKCVKILTPAEFEEAATYLILHTSHFNNDHTKAFELLFEKLPNSVILKQLLTHWYFQDFFAWRTIRDKLQYNLGYYKLMSFGEHRILDAYLKDIGKAYFIFSKKTLENVSGHKWESLKEEYDIHWTLSENDSDTITVRTRVKRQTAMA